MDYKGKRDWFIRLSNRIKQFEGRYMSDTELMDNLGLPTSCYYSERLDAFYAKLRSGELNIEGLLGPHGYTLYQALKIKRAAELEKERAKHMDEA